MKTLYLDIEYDYNFDVYGVVSSIKEYKLAWALNKLFNIKLSKQKDLCYDLLGKERMIISNFEFNSEQSSIRLLRNRALSATTLKKPFLLPDVKEYDYILQITGSLQHMYPQDFLKALLNLPVVQYVKRFDPLTLKFKENLIY